MLAAAAVVVDYDEVVLIVHPFDIVQNLVFVEEVELVVHYNYFDSPDHDYYYMTMMMDDCNLQSRNYLFDHYVVYHWVEVDDDNQFLHHDIVVDDSHHHRHRHHDLFVVEGCNHRFVIDLDCCLLYHRRHRHHHD